MAVRYRVMIIAAFLVAAIVATTARLPLVAAASTDLVATHVTDELPLTDPNSPLWQGATPLEVLLSGQSITRPLAPQPSANSVSVRALTDGRWIAFRIEWADATQNDGLGHDAFKDSVAIQFPNAGGQPFVCMGISGDTVSILHWRSDFQADIENGGGPTTQSLYPGAGPGYYPLAGLPAFPAAVGAGNPIAALDKLSPVESLVAGGFGTLEASGRGEAAGWAAWSDGRWSAVIARPLRSLDPAGADLAPGAQISLAFAVWDGARGDINGKKSVSSWVTLLIEQPAPVAAPAPAAPAPVAPTAAPPPAPDIVEAPPVGAYIAIAAFAGIAAAIVLGTAALVAVRRPRRGS